MESYVFWDSETRLCVVICEGASPQASLALAAGPEDRRQVIATDIGGGAAGSRFLIGAIPQGCVEAIVVDLDRPDERLETLQLGSAGAAPDKHWAAALFAPKTATGEHELTLLRVPADHSREYLLQMAINTIANRGVAPDRCWMVAALTARSATVAAEPAALVFPPVPTLLVSAAIDALEEAPQRGPFETDLLEQAFKPQTGLPRLTLIAAEPKQLAGAGPIVVVTIGHQIRFFTQKDEFLRTVGLPAVNSLTPEDLFQDETDPLKSSSTASIRFAWENGKTFRDRTQLRQVVVEIAADGRSALIRYNEAAVGDDLYLVAQQPLFLTPERETLAKIIGFRVDLSGFELLDATAPDVASLLAEAERIAASTNRQSLDLDGFSAQTRTARPSPARPLNGLLQLAYERIKRSPSAPSFATFAAAPAIHGELTAWSDRAVVSAMSRATLARSLAAAADVATQLSDRPSLAEECYVIRSLRDGERMKRLRGARIMLPLSQLDAERALEAATVLADDDLVEEAEEIAFERGDFTSEGALRKFRERGPSEWTPLSVAEPLRQKIADLLGDDVVEKDKRPVDDSDGRSRRLEEECRSFEEQLQSARTLGEASGELDKIDADYRARKANAKLDTRRTLPRLRKRLAALTTGPVIERNFKQAVEQLEAWATLPQFSSALLGGEAGALSLERWDAIIARLKPPSYGTTADATWRSVRKSLSDSIAQDWRRLHMNLQSDDIERRAAIVEQYAQALFHHRVYTALDGAAGKDARLANALRSWPQDAGFAWRIAAERLDEAELRKIAEPPQLAPETIEAPLNRRAAAS